MDGFKHFGVMLDVSRNGVMKKETLFPFIDLIAKLGYDTLELYSEDIYKLRDRPYFGYMRGAYSIEEIKHNILSFAEHLIVHKNAENAQKAVDVE